MSKHTQGKHKAQAKGIDLNISSTEEFFFLLIHGGRFPHISFCLGGPDVMKQMRRPLPGNLALYYGLNSSIIHLRTGAPVVPRICRMEPNYAGFRVVARFQRRICVGPSPRSRYLHGGPTRRSENLHGSPTRRSRIRGGWAAAFDQRDCRKFNSATIAHVVYSCPCGNGMKH